MQLTYENNFKSQREDGRFVSHMAAHMEKMRHYKPILALPEDITAEEFPVWKAKVKEKLIELLCMPEFTEQPPPKRLWSKQREGYRVEKWELYPDDYEAVPFLMLIPDGVSAENKAPAVLCIPGSGTSKEFLAGEPLFDRPVCAVANHPDRNKMALHMVKNGYVAVAFDNPETAECSVADRLYSSRIHMCFGYIQSGLCYAGVSTFEKLCAIEFIKTLDFVDIERIAVSGHSLGATPTKMLAIISDDIKAVVYNDFVCEPINRYAATTEEDDSKMDQNTGNWHEIPGLWKWFSDIDLLAAIAPKPLALNEGGAINHIETPRRAYELLGISDRLQVTHYPKYADCEKKPTKDYGYSVETYFEVCNVDAADHSFRPEASLNFLKKFI